jgi:CheY-like chemotaxis protein
MIMPGMDGNQTFDRLREIRPQLPVLLSSGYAIDGQAIDIMQKGCNGFIQKPFSISELSQKIRDILDKREAIR